MNSLNEDISVKKLRERNSKIYETANKLSNPHPAPSQLAGLGLTEISHGMTNIHGVGRE